MSADPLLDKIHTLRQRRVMASGAEFIRIEQELREAETQLTDRELSEYLAGESPRATAHSEGPVSAEPVAAILGFMHATGSPLVPFPPRSEPLPPVNPTRRDFAPGGEYRA